MPKTLPIVFLLIGFGIILFVLANFSPIKVSLPGLEGLKISNQSSWKTATPYPTPYTGPRPETVIISGPKDWEEISDNNVAVFQFVAIWGGDQRGLVFETKVDGIDTDWQVSSSNIRVVQLLPGERTYYFYVRAKTKDGIEDYTPAQRVFRAKLSDKAGQVKIASVYPQNTPQKLTLVNRSGTNIDLNGWVIESNSRSYSIGSAVKFFRINSSLIWQNIILNPQDSLTVVGATSPIAVNFYLNRCFGYLTNSYNFYNLFRLDCPRPLENDISYLSSDCQRYINNLGRCQIPTSIDINRFVGDFSCQQFLNSYYGYENCVNRYQNNSDFFQNEWYVFVNNSLADNSHDKIVLRDNKGLVVDAYQY